MKEHSMMIPVPRWRLVAETGHGYDELNDDERQKLWDYLCTDQTPALLAAFRSIGEKIGRRARQRVDAAVMKVLEG